MSCWNSADLCGVRISLLDADGTPLCSEPDGSAYSLTPISLAVTPTLDTGETVTTRTGCGDICYTRTDPDVATGADIVLTLCTFDPEFIALAVAAEQFTENGQPGWAKGVVAADPVELHAWTKSLDGSSQNAAPNSYWHHVWPNVTFTLGNYTLGRDSLQLPLNGTASPSSSIFAGGFSDIPFIADPFYEAHWTSDDIPVASESPYNQHGLACGFVDTPSCASS